MVALAGVIALVLVASTTLAQTDSPFVRLDPANTTSGYLARLLINEVPFPGERAYVSEAETQGGMVEILWVLHSRLRQIPAGYRQEHVAGVRSADIIDIISGTGERRQCEGFYRNASGQFVVAPRVEERLNYLLKIANSGGKPGRFADLLNFGQGLARAYVKEGIAGADRYARLTRVGQTPGHGTCLFVDDRCRFLSSRRKLCIHSQQRRRVFGWESVFYFEKDTKMRTP